jgi:hypothetical protein
MCTKESPTAGIPPAPVSLGAAGKQALRPNRGLSKQQLEPFATLKLLFFFPPIKNSGNAILKRIAVAYPKWF